MRDAWGQKDWPTCRIASEKMLSVDPENEFAQFVFDASSILGQIPAASGQWQLNEPPVDADPNWTISHLYVSGLLAQHKGDLETAQKAFMEYLLRSGRDGDWKNDAAHRIEQCKSHDAYMTGWTPLITIREHAASLGNAWELIDVPDSIGRWIETPSELQSRHDRRAGFSGCMFVHPFQQKAYFASDRSGEGHTDICEVEVLANGEYGEVKRLLGPINSSADERTPYYDPQTNRLFWSANRKDSWGGFDVYYTTLNTLPSVVQALPFAINSTSDETHYTPLPDGWTAWVCTNRSGGIKEALQFISDGPKRHPVEMEFAWNIPDDFEPSMHLSIWNLDAGQMLWGGEMEEPAGRASFIGEDGMRLRARVSSNATNNYAVTEWELPVTANARAMRYEWTELRNQPTLVQNELAQIKAGLLHENWSRTQSYHRLPDPPNRPISADELPGTWGRLAEGANWQHAAWEERWLLTSALQSMTMKLDHPAAPKGKGWSDIQAGLNWTETSLKPFTRRLKLMTHAHKTLCGASATDAWGDACEEMSMAMQQDRRTIENGLVWNRIARSVESFSRLRNDMPPEAMRAMLEVKWFLDAESIMNQALIEAMDAASWFPMIGTEEVWRDWLWVAWHAFVDHGALEASDPRLEATWWELEQSFIQPSWQNLEAASHALSNLILGVAPEDVITPEELAAYEVEAFNATRIDAVGSKPESTQPNRSNSTTQSVYAIQLGAFISEPDGWPFWGMQEDLIASESEGWIKVAYTGFEDQRSASEFMHSIQAFGDFADAFVIEVSDPSEWQTKTFDRMAGFGVQGRVSDELEIQRLLKEKGALDLHVWPIDGESYGVLFGPYWSEGQAELVAAGLSPQFEALSIQSYPKGAMQPFVKERTAEATPSTLTSASNFQRWESNASIAVDNSLWRIRIATFPNGADDVARAAFHSIPDTLDAQSIPNGSGEDYITRIIQGESAAMQAMNSIRAIGFSNARLIPIH